ncbi:MAG: DUF6808 domain-containing protein [Alistipes indistinctus]
MYEGEDYRAVVSGFRASLDTLDIFRKTQDRNEHGRPGGSRFPASPSAWESA